MLDIVWLPTIVYVTKFIAYKTVKQTNPYRLDAVRAVRTHTKN